MVINQNRKLPSSMSHAPLDCVPRVSFHGPLYPGSTVQHPLGCTQKWPLYPGSTVQHPLGCTQKWPLYPGPTEPLNACLVWGTLLPGC